MSIIVLGPQASSPARVERNQLTGLNINATQLAALDEGRRGRLRSQDEQLKKSMTNSN
ncbi:MAG TPA: hypothetical protein VIX17_26280 [Pyrinomonadaceae bacterium]|jgi:hypothetical protein